MLLSNFADFGIPSFSSVIINSGILLRPRITACVLQDIESLFIWNSPSPY